MNNYSKIKTVKSMNNYSKINLNEPRNLRFWNNIIMYFVK